MIMQWFCLTPGGQEKIKIKSFRNKISSLRGPHPLGTGKEVGREGDDGCTWERESDNCCLQSDQQGHRAVLDLGNVCMAYTTHMLHLGFGMKSCKPPWSPCPLTMITRARTCESHPDLGDIIASAGVCCSAMLLLNAELGCWEKHSCHTAGPGVPSPGTEGYPSFPSCTWHMAFTMPVGAEGTFPDKASVNLPCRNRGHPVWSLQGRMQIPAVSGVPSGAADVPHLAVRLKYRTHMCVTGCRYLQQVS